MPIRSPGYTLPQFSPTGNADVDKVLETWRQDFGAQYTRNLYEAERIPAGFSTSSTVAQTLATAYSSFIGKQVGFQGNEQCFVFASVQFNTQGGVPAAHTIRVTYPDGSQQTLTSMTASLDPPSTFPMTATITGVWQVSPRIQVGGKHIFDVMVATGATGATTNTAAEANLTILQL